MTIQYGLTLPYGHPRVVADLARLAEEFNWDGVFVGDAIWCHDPIVQLSAAAMVTQRIRLGSMVLAVPMRRPWRIASESLALDHLSNGRLTLGLATGATWMGWQSFPNEVTGMRARAEMLDETIEIITRLHQREQFDFEGKHYQIRLSQMETRHYPPKSVQQPRVPIWTPGVWPRMKSMQRLLKCDGLLPMKMDAENKFCDVTPSDLGQMKAYIDANRLLNTPFDYVVEGQLAGKSRSEQQEKLDEWAGAGMTWWIESNWTRSEEEIEQIIRQGPPLRA